MGEKVSSMEVSDDRSRNGSSPSSSIIRGEKRFGELSPDIRVGWTRGGL